MQLEINVECHVCYHVIWHTTETRKLSTLEIPLGSLLKYQSNIYCRKCGTELPWFVKMKWSEDEKSNTRRE